jgi:uncharacterized protein (DUF983 family)
LTEGSGSGGVSAAILNGLKARCPRCGQGKLFERYLKFAPRCSQCGADFSIADTGDGAAVFVMFIVGAIVVPLAFIMQFSFNSPAWLTMTVTIAATAALCLVLLPAFKALLFTLQWTHKAEEGRLEE